MNNVISNKTKNVHVNKIKEDKRNLVKCKERISSKVKIHRLQKANSVPDLNQWTDKGVKRRRRSMDEVITQATFGKGQYSDSQNSN